MSINETCSDSSPCNDQAGLNCTNGVCDCSPSQYFNGKIGNVIHEI